MNCPLCNREMYLLRFMVKHGWEREEIVLWVCDNHDIKEVYDERQRVHCVG